MIIDIDRFVLQEACRQMSAWQKQLSSSPALLITVNISTKHFDRPGLIERIDQVLNETGLDAASLVLEITEGAFIDDVEATISILSQLKSRGIQIQIDDFGTGYSSLGYLHRFPIDAIKIDRSFISGVGINGESKKIVKTIVRLAHNLGMSVIAEGIETEDQLAQIKKYDCEYGQGFFFAKPGDSKETADSIRDSTKLLTQA